MNYAYKIRHYAEDDRFTSKMPTGMMLGIAEGLEELEQSAKRFSADPTPEHRDALTEAIFTLIRSEDANPRPILGVK